MTTPISPIRSGNDLSRPNAIRFGNASGPEDRGEPVADDRAMGPILASKLWMTANANAGGGNRAINATGSRVDRRVATTRRPLGAGVCLAPLLALVHIDNTTLQIDRDHSGWCSCDPAAAAAPPHPTD